MVLIGANYHDQATHKLTLLLERPHILRVVATSLPIWGGVVLNAWAFCPLSGLMRMVR